MLDQLQGHINGLNAHTPLLSKFPVPARTNYGWSLLLAHNPMQSAPIEADNQLVALPFGHIYPLYCAGLDIGYLIELPSQYIIIQRNMVSSVRRRAARTEVFKDVTMLLKTKYITVFGAQDDAVLVIANRVSLFPMKKVKE
jgi:hypothetical protein